MEPKFAGIPDDGLEEEMQIYSNKVYFLWKGYKGTLSKYFKIFSV
jgi:hypothetical protein